MKPDLIGGRYRVSHAVGRGGMGTVWLCRDEKLGRDVAVKQVGLLPGESVTDSARALREARTSASLSHRNLVTVFDVVEEGGAIWMVMEYVPSRALSDIIGEDGRLEPHRVAAIGAQVAAALAATHAAGTTHRDVKPGNVLVTEDGTAKVGDFGIARTVGDPALTQTGFVTGTPGYFSPELARGEDPGPASDVWALGATLYAAVEGHSPYPEQRNPMAMLTHIATHQPPRPTHAGFLQQPLMRMLDRDPESRWSMADAAHSLRRLADGHAPDRTRESTRPTAPPALAPGEPMTRHEPGGTSTTTPAAGRRRSRRAALAAVLALVVVAALAGVAYLAASRDGGGESGASGATSASPRSSPSTTPSSTSEDSRSSPAPRGGAAKVAFLRDYFATAPDDRDAGWAMLGPNEQSVGRSSYDDFWGSIESVDVGRFDPRGNSVELDITYHYADGRVVAERQRLDLVRAGGKYLIDNDDVLSSRTVSQ